MAKENNPITIKKYANRRLYNTGTSAYVTLEDLATMVKKGEDFVVFDAKSGDEITHSVLTQIIFEQESKVGQSLLPITFLRQMIRFYGDSMQMLVPSYLEFTIEKLTSDQAKFRDKVAGGLGVPLAGPVFGPIEEQTRKNLALFNQALAMFTPFTAPAGTSEKPAEEPPSEASARSDLEGMKHQLQDLQKKIEGLASKE
jgi:polyhydroxyalkanoate synthesis repressor PhaR